MNLNHITEHLILTTATSITHTQLISDYTELFNIVMYKPDDYSFCK